MGWGMNNCISVKRDTLLSPLEKTGKNSVWKQLCCYVSDMFFTWFPRRLLLQAVETLSSDLPYLQLHHKKPTACMYVLTSAYFEWELTTFSLFKYKGKSLDMIAAYCRRTLLIVCREEQRQFNKYSLFSFLLLNPWNILQNFQQSQPNHKISSNLLNIPMSLFRSIAKSLTVSYYY